MCLKWENSLHGPPPMMPYGYACRIIYFWLYFWNLSPCWWHNSILLGRRVALEVLNINFRPHRNILYWWSSTFCLEILPKLITITWIIEGTEYILIFHYSTLDESEVMGSGQEEEEGCLMYKSSSSQILQMVRLGLEIRLILNRLSISSKLINWIWAQKNNSTFFLESTSCYKHGNWGRYRVYWSLCESGGKPGSVGFIVSIKKTMHCL